MLSLFLERIFCYNVWTLWVLVSTSSSVEYCPSGWIKHNQMCYALVQGYEVDNTADNARKTCEALRGSLMNLHTQELNSMAAELVSQGGFQQAFIGLNDREVEGEYIWGDGRKPLFWNWENDQPGPPKYLDIADCVKLMKTGFWHDISCSSHKEHTDVLCEKKQIVVQPRIKRRCVCMQ